MSIPIKQLRPSSQVPQANTSNPISITSPHVDAKKKVKKEKNLAQSAPNPFRPPPPKAPIQRPRVPSCDPPSLDLPPSPLDPPLLLNGLAIAKPKAKEKESKKNISAMSRSLTNNVSFISSSAPPVSYVQFAPANAFSPPVEKPVVEKPKSPKNVTIKETEKKEEEKIVKPEKLPDELLATVGSPTVFSMLRSDGDARRRSSLTSSTPIAFPVVADLPHKDADDDDDDDHPARLDDKLGRDDQFPFDQPDDDVEDTASAAAHRLGSSGSDDKDNYSSLFS